jgi:acyl-CoA synthetase (AMP-forming)/AMP-acid ligase II
MRVLLTSERNVSAARRGAYELVRCYGPAENTEVTTCCALGGGGAGAIVGKPVTHAEAYIIGHDGGLVPVGVTGELCVGVAGLARGYLRDVEATSGTFTPNPHRIGGRIYRTGDWARWLPDGRIELTGHPKEVSIDGCRVSLAEIERCLESHRGIAEAVVVFHDADPFHPRLVAFLVLQGSLQVPPHTFVQELKRHLGQWLPASMVPDAYVQLGQIPRDADGRVRYEWLPIPEQQAADREVPTPQSATARKVTSMIEELLQVRPVGADANLGDLGMDSLTAMSLVSRLQGAFGVAPTVCRVLTTPTPAGVLLSLSDAACGNHHGSRPVGQGARLS